MPRPLQAPFSLLLPLFLAACLDAPPAESEAVAPRAATLQAFDWVGDLAALDALPRWPLLELRDGAISSTSEDAIFLLPGGGGLDRQALLDDLESRPLRAVHLAQTLPVDLGFDPGATRLVPAAALLPGEYVLAVGSWAHDDATAKLWELTVSDAADAGARVVASFPPHGAFDLGTNLRAVTLWFDGAVVPDAGAIWLEAPDGLAVPAEVDFDCGTGLASLAGVSCARLRPTSRLRPESLHRLHVGRALRDPRGGPVGPFSAELHVGRGPDDAAPTVDAPACSIDEHTTPLGCLRVDDATLHLRIAVSEPAAITLAANDRIVHAQAGPGEAALTIADLPADTALVLALRVEDTAGNHRNLELAARTTAPLATLSITEVLADPRGPEPEQEWIEIHNYGLLPVALGGLHLSDDADDLGSEIIGDVMLPAGRRALLVAEGYDALAPDDVAAPPGALRIRVGGSLARGGLSNAGEPIFLRDAQLRRLSAAPATPRPRAGRCLVRVAHAQRSGAPEAFAHTEDGGCTPGW